MKFHRLLSSVHGQRCLLIHGLGPDRRSHGVCPVASSIVHLEDKRTADCRGLFAKPVGRRRTPYRKQTGFRRFKRPERGAAGGGAAKSRRFRPRPYCRHPSCRPDPCADRGIDIDAASPDVLKVDVERTTAACRIWAEPIAVGNRWRGSRSAGWRSKTASQKYYRDDDNTPFRLIQPVRRNGLRPSSPVTQRKPGSSCFLHPGNRLPGNLSIRCATDRLLDASRFRTSD